MPIYQFVCSKCPGPVEEFRCHHSMIDMLACTRCGARLLRVPETASFQIKGHSFKNGYDCAKPVGDGAQGKSEQVLAETFVSNDEMKGR